METTNTFEGINIKPVNNGTTYPCIIQTPSLGDLEPGNPKGYTIDPYDEDIDYTTIRIPDRKSFYHLMKDICDNISSEIQAYLKLGAAPADDSTSDISIATELLSVMSSYDE